MLKKTVCALAVLPAIYAGASQASSVDTAIVSANRALSVSLGALNQNYRELDSGGSVLDKENGTIPRIGIEYSLMGLQTPLRFYMSADYAGGDTSYKGALQNGTPYDTTTGNKIVDLNVGLGYAFGFGRFAVIPGVEYGYSNWQRDVGKGDPYHGVKETYSHGHMAATLSGQFAMTPKAVLSLGVAYGKTVAPTMKIDEQFGHSVISPTFNLGSKPWSRLSIGLDYAAKKTLHIGGRLAYTQFRYGASPYYPVGTGTAYEPDSKTRLTTFDFVVSYNF
jgi:hypothetical protein